MDAHRHDSRGRLAEKKTLKLVTASASAGSVCWLGDPMTSV